MKKSQRLAAVVAVTMTAGIALAGCSTGGSGGDGDKVTLNMLVPTYSDKTKELWNDVKKGFEAKNKNITLNIETASWDDLDKTITTKIQGKQAPDIFNGGPFISYAQDDLLYPVEEVTSPETFKDFQESFLKNEEYNGKPYALPFIASARALFVNTDLLQKAGVAAAPKTWDELLDASKKISALGGGVAGYGMPLGSEEAQAEAAIWLWGGGGSFSEGEKVTIDTPKNLVGAEQIKKMIDAGATQKDPGASDRTPLLEIFMQGKIGMQVALPQTVGQIKEKYPNLKYEIAPIPTKDGSPMTLGVEDQLMAFKNDGKKQESIKKFFDYFYSKDVYVTWVQAEGFLPTTKSGSEALAGDETLKPFLELLPNAKFYPSTNGAWSTADAAFKSLFGEIQKKPAADVLKAIQSKVDAG